ncbi:MarR family transcriptional regulator [Halocatena halophila]|uniref:MarR family transcriptional regulator n=1 Tax=Halocatena halophila TaxID=2814576 RepID=UPI002ED02389
MPIDIERFEESDESELRARSPTNAEIILTFLASDPEQAYLPKEIHDRTGVPRGSVGVVLSRLEDRGLVRHRGEYWAITESDEIHSVLSTLRSAAAVSDRFGPEDPEEWGPGIGGEQS